MKKNGTFFIYIFQSPDRKTLVMLIGIPPADCHDGAGCPDIRFYLMFVQLLPGRCQQQFHQVIRQPWKYYLSFWITQTTIVFNHIRIVAHLHEPDKNKSLVVQAIYAKSIDRRS